MGVSIRRDPRLSNSGEYSSVGERLLVHMNRNKLTSLLGLVLAITAQAQLQDALDERANASRTNLPAPVRETMAGALAELQASGITDRALQVGDRAPAFSLPDPSGTYIDSADLLAKGPVVIVFYRGAWCPFCNLTLAAYQDYLDEIDAAGATLVAISPEKPDAAADLIEKSSLTFPVLTDANNAYARALGIVYELTPDLAALYQQFGIPLAPKAGSPGAYELPLSATYVIGRDGIVRYAFLDVDYTRRAEPAEVVRIVESL